MGTEQGVVRRLVEQKTGRLAGSQQVRTAIFRAGKELAGTVFEPARVRRHFGITPAHESGRDFRQRPRIAESGAAFARYKARDKMMGGMWKGAVVLVLAAGCACVASAQAVAEAAGATANSSMAASGIKMPVLPTIQPPKPNSSSTSASSGPQVVGKDSAFMIAPSGPPPEEVNRKDLEENAGPNAGKLFLRSVPDHAIVFINGKIVGKTPLLLVVPPGKYDVEMRGPRQGNGSQTVGLLPKEMQKVVIKLKERYPSTVRAF